MVMLGFINSQLPGHGGCKVFRVCKNSKVSLFAWVQLKYIKWITLSVMTMQSRKMTF